MKSAFWNIAFAVFFVFIVLNGVDWLVRTGPLVRPFSIGDFLLITLATFRLIRLMSYDVITKFIRDWAAKAPEDSFVGTFSALLHCPWCTGLWFSFFVVFFYFATPFAWPIVLVLAIAGIASLLQILANLLGWQAEGKKRQVLGESEASRTTCG